MTDTFSLLDDLRYAGRCWAILPEALAAMQAVEDKQVSIDQNVLAQIEAQRGQEPAPKQGEVAIIPLKGTITPEGSLLAQIFGIESGLKSFTRRLVEAAGNPDVKSIVINVDSPGGLVDQVPETAAMVRRVAARKPVVAVANPMAASAAYWIAASATQLVGSTSSETGSIGVYQLHRDLSVAHEKAGVTPTLISAGKYKTEGNPFEPLDEEAAGALQQAVDDYYELFVTDVAEGRGVSENRVRNGYGEGRVLTAKRARSAGLIDTIGTLEEVVGSLSAGKMPSRRRAEDNHTVLAIGDEVIWTSADFADEAEAEMDYTAEERLRIFNVMTTV